MKKKFTVVDLFSGAGGLTTGLKKAGLNVAAAVEIDPVAAKTYKKNHRNTKVFNEDIRKVKKEDILKATPENMVDVLVGCPPCQGFSSLTLKNKKEDDRNLLVLEFLKKTIELQPKIVMMENVPGLANRGNYLFKQVVTGLENLGYKVNYNVLQTADYGVPQRRRRLVLIAGKGFYIPIPAPTHSYKETNGLLKWKTLRDTISMLGSPYNVDELKNKVAYSKINWHVSRKLSKTNLARIKTLKAGDSRYSIPENLRPACHKGKNKGFGNVYGRLAWDEPSVTITRGCATLSMGKFGHPTENRALSVREAALIQTFPLKYKFDAKSVEEACILIGNAFPCLLAEQLGKQITKYLRESLIYAK